MPVTGALGGLAPSTTYHFRVVATNATGTTTGADRRSRPWARRRMRRRRQRPLEETTATLNAIVNPRNGATTYYFELGLTSAYGDRVPAAAAVVGSDNVTHALQQALSGLVAGTTYHYRVVAMNATGTTYGADQTFTTVAPAPFMLPVTLPATAVVPPAVAPPGDEARLGQSAKIAATAGEVLVELPGTGVFIPLSAASTVPVGTTIDATRGTLKLTNVRDRSGKLQTGTFWGGRSPFARPAASRLPPS